MIKLPTLNDRLGLFSTWLKAFMGLTPQQLHMVFSVNKHSILVTVYPTRSKLISYDSQDVPTVHFETSSDIWWENIRDWPKYCPRLSEELLEGVAKVKLNGVTISINEGMEELFRLKQLMTMGTGLKEVVFRFVNKDLIIVDYDTQSYSYSLAFCLVEE